MRAFGMIMPNGGLDGVVQVWEHGSSNWVEFRGPAYHLWDPDEEASPMQQVHDALEGWHACVLHTGTVLDVFPHHPDHMRVADLMERASEV